MTHLLLTVRFLDDRYHGLLDRGGPPEWPPSPFRLFSALVAGVARRGELDTAVGKSLEWLQGLAAPIIIAPRSKTGQGITRFVPNNDGDKKFDRQERLTAKPTIPTLFLLEADQKPEVHYVWDISEHSDAPVERVRDAARSLTTLGWGIDMAFADADQADEAKLQSLKGIRWRPKEGAWRDEGMLRVPTANADLQECTLCDLRHCHATAMNRIVHGEPLHTVDKPRVFERVFYASAERPIARPTAVFELRHDDGSFCRYPQRKLSQMAGMVRHLAIESMTKAPPGGVGDDWVESYVAGHRGANADDHRQFSYLPLPSIGMQYTDPSIRRVMIAAPVGDDAWLEHLAQRLAGQQLKPVNGDAFGEKEPPSLLRVYRDKVSSPYTAAANRWASVTPVILPGHDDKKPAKMRKLIEKALATSGIEQPCEFEWSPISRFRKSLSAHKYHKDNDTNTKRWQFECVKEYLRGNTWTHLTLRFGRREDPDDPDSRWIPAIKPVPGPLVIGAGRHCGFGLMAGIDT